MPVDSHEIEKFARDLDKMAKRAIPHAMRNSLNRSAFAGRKILKREISKQFTERNSYTQRSVRVTKARGTNLRTMEALMGSVAPYMGERERGKTKKGSLPTPIAAGQSQGTIPRTRLVRGANKLGRIRMGKKAKGGNRRQRNAASIRQAASEGRKFAYIETPSKRLVVRVTGKRKLKVRTLWDVTRASHTIAPMPTMAPTLRKLERVIPRIHLGSLKEQVKRNGLFVK
jgi:hypothetical protein